MTTPATAFAPGSPANGPSVVTSALKALTGGGGIPLPSIASSANSASGDAMQTGSHTGDGFNVNYGNGVSQGGAVPSYVWIAAAVGVGLWAWKKYT